jgi:outer membrane protein
LLGERKQITYKLLDEPIHPSLLTNDWQLIQKALSTRPEIAQGRFEAQSATKFASAEKGLNYPSIRAFAAAGILPVHNAALPDNYEAAGINIQLPIFDGFLFSARESEAKLKAEAVAQNLQGIENDVIRDTRLAVLNRNYAFKRLDLTAKLLESAKKAYDLAHERYQVGSSSIVELSQAQLNQTEAEIRYAKAKYEFQIRNAALNFQIGVAGAPP